MRGQRLTYRFHDPNPPGVAAEHILKVFLEADAPKVEQAIRAAMAAERREEELEQEHQERDETVLEPEEMEGMEELEEEETPSQGWEMTMVM